MPALSIEVPFPVFQDRDGQPLDNGYVWIGVANLNPQTNPVAVYFDSALTVPATQPLRTINGYVSSSGSPAQVYIDGAGFSILVQDSKGTMVYNFPEGNGIGANACGLTYDPPFTNAVETPVCVKLAETVSFADFGAVGDGVTNDATAVQATITAGAGRVIDGQGKTYKINSPITGVASNTVIQNAVFDFSTMPNGVGIDRCITASGSIGTPVSLTADTLIESNIITVADTSVFAKDDLVFLESSAVWDSLTSTTYGQYARIDSIDSGTQMQIYASVLLDFRTSDSATISKVTPVKNVSFNNVRFIGANANSQNALFVNYGEDCNVNNCIFEYLDYLAISFSRCYNSTINSTRIKFARIAGTAYGFSIANGCYGCSITNSWGEDCRHTVTIGGNDGLNIHTRIENNTAISNKDAGFDSHSASIYTSFIGNIVECSADRFLTSNHDGIVCQGAHAVIANNMIIANKGAGIIYQPLFQNGYVTSVVITGNKIIGDDIGYGTVSANGIICTINSTGGANINGAIIKGNAVAGGENNTATLRGIQVVANRANSTIENVVIEGNVTSTKISGTGILVRSAGANSVVRNVTVANNSISTSSSTGIYFLSDGAGSLIENLTGGNNIIDAVTTGIIFNDSVGAINNIRFGYNIYKNVVNNFTVNNSENYILLDATAAAPITTGSSTYTLSARSNKFIFNRAGTVTVTLPSATTSVGLQLFLKTLQAQTVVSASANIVPIDSTTAGTDILPATAGAWCTLASDGINWVVIARGT